MDELRSALHEAGPDRIGVFGTLDEMDLASRLLEVSDESELDQFLGILLKRASQSVRRSVNTSLGRALGSLLKGAARKIGVPALNRLQVAPATVVSAFPGSGLLSRAGRLFGIELEGLSPEDQDFEVARRFVRFSGEAVRRAGGARQATPAAATAAVAQAARKHAPGLLARPTAACGCRANACARTRGGGQWMRRGPDVVLENC